MFQNQSQKPQIIASIIKRPFCLRQHLSHSNVRWTGWSDFKAFQTACFTYYLTSAKEEMSVCLDCLNIGSRWGWQPRLDSTGKSARSRTDWTAAEGQRLRLPRPRPPPQRPHSNGSDWVLTSWRAWGCCCWSWASWSWSWRARCCCCCCCCCSRRWCCWWASRAWSAGASGAPRWGTSWRSCGSPRAEMGNCYLKENQLPTTLPITSILSSWHYQLK